MKQIEEETEVEKYERKLLLAALIYVYSNKSGHDAETGRQYLRTGVEALEASKNVEKHNQLSFANAVAKVEKMFDISK